MKREEKEIDSNIVRLILQEFEGSQNRQSRERERWREIIKTT
jgi:hypothetical protein